MNIDDLNNSIENALQAECEIGDLKKVCSLAADSYGRYKIKKRVQEMITKEGMTTVQSCLAQIEYEL